MESNGNLTGLSAKLSSTMLVTVILLSVAIFTMVPPITSATFGVGVKTGDRIKYDYTITGWPAGTPYPEWLKVEFLSVEGTDATVQAKMHMSDEAEQNQTMTINIVSGEGASGTFSGLVIPADCTNGDLIYISGYGSVTIDFETSGVYAGATRTVVGAWFSQGGTELTYYWDKQTGVMVESHSNSGGIYATAMATETNMWQGQLQVQITIKADGSVDPPTAPVLTLDNVTYTLTSNFVSSLTGIIVERDNIIIDGDQHTVQGPSNNGVYSGSGIDLTERSNVTVKNTIVSKFGSGIYFRGTNKTTINGNTITNNAIGIESAPSGPQPWHPQPSGNSISRNNITRNGYGIFLKYSSNNTMAGNNITNNDYGIYLISSSDNNISENRFVNAGLFVASSFGNVVSDNFVNGKPLVYLEAASDVAVSDAGQVVLVQCNHTRVENLNLSNSTVGVELCQTNNTVISGNNITSNTGGIALISCSNVSINGNNITNNWNGISLGSSFNNSISGNNITRNKESGIELSYSNYNILNENNIKTNHNGIVFYWSCSGNKFYHNNFNNTRREEVYLYSSSANIWDDGYPSGGNYWGQHNPTDIDKDKIGDPSYTIDENNIDRYPLIYPFECYDHTYVCSPDLNKDGKVNIVDVTKVATAFGSVPGGSNWSPTADMDLNEVINIVDVSKVAKEFGKEWVW